MLINRVKPQNNDGYGVSIFGHHGDIIIDGLEYSGNYGALELGDDLYGNAYPLPSGHMVKSVVIKNVNVSSPSALYHHIAISAVQQATIESFTVIGNRTALDLFPTSGGSIDNGSVVFTFAGAVSAYAGFQSANKIRYQDDELTDPQIDAMF